MQLDSSINKIQAIAKSYPQDSSEYRVLSRTIKKLKKIMKKGIKKS